MEWDIDYSERRSSGWHVETSEDWLLHSPEKARSYRAHARERLRLEQRQVKPALREVFTLLRDTWRQQTSHLSSTTARSMHPAYQRIIGLGKDVLPLLLEEMEQRPAQWTWALQAITGEDPVPSEDRGALRKERDAWLGWGRRNGLL